LKPPATRYPDQKITRKETTMKSKTMTPTVALVLVAGFAALTLALSTGVASVSAQSERSGVLHVTKNCSAFTLTPGSFCTITSSNLAEITVGSKVFYDYPIILATPTGLFDSDIVLNVGPGDWAVGRCTLDNTTNLGLCTFSDGDGQFVGFNARVNVSSTDGINYQWNGTYSFSPERK
jgi:hypothetical protein